MANNKKKHRHIIPKYIENKNDDYISLADITGKNIYNNGHNNGYNNGYNNTYTISKPTISTQVEQSTPYPLLNEMSNISNLFDVPNQDTEATLTTLTTIDDITVITDNENENENESEYEYAPTETTRTATFKDNRSRRLSDEEYVMDYNDQMPDTIPDIINEITSSRRDTKDIKEKHKKKKRRKETDYDTMSIKYSLNKPILIDTPSTQTHNGYNKHYIYKKHRHKHKKSKSKSKSKNRNRNNNKYNISMNNRSFSASEYSSESPHITTHNITNTSKYSSINMGLFQSDSNNVCMSGMSPDEMDEDFYDLLSDAICDLFSKLDTRNNKAVNYDIIKIGFSLLDINLSSNQFNTFINELTNFKLHKMIKLDMLRSFILNIQNKNYNFKLKQIRMIIIDGLLSQPINRGHSLNDTNTIIRHNRQSTQSTMTTYKKHKKAMSTLSTLPSINSMENISKTQQQTDNINTNNKLYNYSDPTIPILPKLPTMFKSSSTECNSTSPNNNNNIWRAHITDHDENGPCQYDLLLCTLKYSLISTTIDLYNNRHSLDINNDKFYMYINNQQQKQALSYLFACFFNFLGNYIEYMSLKLFECGLKTCGITFDRHDIAVISFGQLSSAFTGSGSKNTNKNAKHKKSKLFITQNSFVSWLLKNIYCKQNTNYKNYTKHYHQYYKWIENDLFSLVNPSSNTRKIRKKNHSHHYNYTNIPKIRKKHKSHNYHNPVIPKTKKKQKHKKRRHKSHQIQIQQHHRNDMHNYSDHNYSDII